MKKSVLGIGQSEEIWHVLGEKIVCKVGSRQTFGRFALVEQTSPAGGTVPPHFHQLTDEIIYILEGRYEIQTGETTFTAVPGEMIFIPRGTTHGFRNVSPGIGKILAVITPGGFENFFAEISRLSPDELKDAANIVEIGRRNDLELVM